MAQNTQPTFTNSNRVQWGKITGVDGSADGTDTDVKEIFTAHATNGSYVSSLTAIPISTSGVQSTSATVLRLYLNNGSDVSDAANNILRNEMYIPSVQVDDAAPGTAISSYPFILNLRLPPGYRLFVGMTAIAANTQWNVIAEGGDY